MIASDSVRFALLTALATLAAGVGRVAAQDAALLPSPQAPSIGPRGATLANASLLYQTLPPEAMVKPLGKNDQITVLVDYRAVMQSEGSGEAIKQGLFNAVLSEWLKFDGEDLFPAEQRRGDPAVVGTLNSQLRAESAVDQRESLTFPIAATIVDIRPNGNLVIEGWRSVRVNEERWKTYISGTVSRPMIGPDRVVRDTAIADLRIEKYEEGIVRDGYSRGWLARWWGQYKPF